jgi:hypothetical protein
MESLGRIVSTRQFAVRCARINNLASDPTVADTFPPPSPSIAEQLQAELEAGGLEEVVVVPDAEGDRLTIRGLAPAESRDATRAFVEDLIYDVTLDLVIIEPGVWVDDSIR